MSTPRAPQTARERQSALARSRSRAAARGVVATAGRPQPSGRPPSPSRSRERSAPAPTVEARRHRSTRRAPTSAPRRADAARADASAGAKPRRATAHSDAPAKAPRSTRRTDAPGKPRRANGPREAPATPRRATERTDPPVSAGRAAARRSGPPTRRSGMPRRRLMVMLAAIVAVFGAFGYRVVQLQALEPERYVAHSESQTLRTQTLAAGRGSIYDRSGYELALSIPQRTVYTDPLHVDDPAATAARLAPVLGMDAADLEAKLSADNRFGYLARQVPDDTARLVADLELEGVYFLEEPHRFNPSGDLARSLIGQTDIDNHGMGGIELQFEEVLTGTPGTLTYEQDPEGRTISAGEQHLVPAVAGDGVVLTLDRALQYQAERILEDHIVAQAADGGMLVAMEPGTGEILAMANVELHPETQEPAVSGNNLALTTVYEPGSVMKVVPIAGAIEQGLASAHGACVNAPDTIEVAGSTFKEFEPHGGGCWPLTDVVVHSSNTASINLALMLGSERLHGYFDAFGFGRPTGLGFPNESSGSVRPVEEWWGTSIATMPIGQGIAVTPLQMLLAYNTIANDGTFVPPSLVRSTVTADGRERPVATGASRQVVSPEAASQLRAMLAEVPARGTAQTAQVPGFAAAGKTGTAQMPAPDGGYIWPDGSKRYMATFCGFLPADDPQLSVCAVIRNPTGGLYTGGSVAGPVFADFARFAITHLQISPPHDDGAGLDGTTAPPDGVPGTPGRFYTGLGEPPEGRLRAEPTRVATDDPPDTGLPVTGDGAMEVVTTDASDATAGWSVDPTG